MADLQKDFQKDIECMNDEPMNSEYCYNTTQANKTCCAVTIQPTINLELHAVVDDVQYSYNNSAVGGRIVG